MAGGLASSLRDYDADLLSEYAEDNGVLKLDIVS